MEKEKYEKLELYKEDAYATYNKIREIEDAKNELRTKKKLNKIREENRATKLLVFAGCAVGAMFGSVIVSPIIGIPAGLALSVVSITSMTAHEKNKEKKYIKNLQTIAQRKPSEIINLWERYTLNLNNINVYLDQFGLDKPKNLPYFEQLKDYKGQIFINQDQEIDINRIIVEKDRMKDEKTKKTLDTNQNKYVNNYVDAMYRDYTIQLDEENIGRRR